MTGLVPVKKEKSSLFTDREREFLSEIMPYEAGSLLPWKKAFASGFICTWHLLSLRKEWCYLIAAMDGSGKEHAPLHLNRRTKEDCFQALKESAPENARSVPLTFREAKEPVWQMVLREYGKERRKTAEISGAVKSLSCICQTITGRKEDS